MHMILVCPSHIEQNSSTYGSQGNITGGGGEEDLFLPVEEEEDEEEGENHLVAETAWKGKML